MKTRLRNSIAVILIFFVIVAFKWPFTQLYRVKAIVNYDPQSYTLIFLENAYGKMRLVLSKYTPDSCESCKNITKGMDVRLRLKRLDLEDSEIPFRPLLNRTGRQERALGVEIVVEGYSFDPEKTPVYTSECFIGQYFDVNCNCR